MANDQRFKILLVEDNDGDAELVKEYIAELGDDEFEMVRAVDLASSLRLLAAGTFDIVLLDLILPDSGGVDTLRAICEVCEETNPLVLVLTGLDDQEITGAAMRDCAEEYLIKSEMTAKNLLRTLRTAVQRHGRRRVEEMQAKGTIRAGDGIEAQRILRRVNRIATAGDGIGGFGHRDSDDVAGVVDDLSTASRATEIVFQDMARKLDDVLNQQRTVRGDVAELMIRARKQEQASHARDVERVNLHHAIRGLRRQMKPLVSLIQGDPQSGKLPLIVRVEALEATHRKWNKVQDERQKTVKEIFVAVAPQLLLAVGGAVVAFITWYLSQRAAK